MVSEDDPGRGIVGGGVHLQVGVPLTQRTPKAPWGACAESHTLESLLSFWVSRPSPAPRGTLSAPPCIWKGVTFMLWGYVYRAVHSGGCSLGAMTLPCPFGTPLL